MSSEEDQSFLKSLDKALAESVSWPSLTRPPHSVDCTSIVLPGMVVDVTLPDDK